MTLALFFPAVAQRPCVDISTRLYGYKNQQGSWQINPKYQIAHPFNDGMRRYAVVKLDNRWGCIDVNGEMIVRNIFNSSEEAAEAGKAWSTNSEPGKWVYPAQNPADKRWGFVDYYGRWKFQPVYEAAGTYIGKDPMAFAPIRTDGRWGCIDAKGILIINNIFMTREEAEAAGRQWINGTCYDVWRMPAKDTRSNLWGYVNYLGRWVVDAKYDACTPYGEDNKYAYAQAQIKGRWGNIDRSGNTVSEPVFLSRADAESALSHIVHERPMQRWRMPVSHPTTGLWGWVDCRGHWVVKPRFEAVTNFDNDTGHFATAKLNGRWACIDFDGNLVSKNVFTLSSEAWRAGHEWDTDQERGHWLYPIKETESEHWGYVDYTGEWVIRPIFEEAHVFFYTRNDRMAPAKLGGRWGCIDHTGRFVVTNQYNTSSEAQVAGRRWSERKKF